MLLTIGGYIAGIVALAVFVLAIKDHTWTDSDDNSNYD